MYDILFDENIYGSNHLTLGNEYEIAPNDNDSSIHWDLVCIGADVYFDGDLMRKGRLFVKEELKELNPDMLLQGYPFTTGLYSRLDYTYDWIILKGSSKEFLTVFAVPRGKFFPNGALRRKAPLRF